MQPTRRAATVLAPAPVVMVVVLLPPVDGPAGQCRDPRPCSTHASLCPHVCDGGLGRRRPRLVGAAMSTPDGIRCDLTSSALHLDCFRRMETWLERLGDDRCCL